MRKGNSAASHLNRCLELHLSRLCATPLSTRTWLLRMLCAMDASGSGRSPRASFAGDFETLMTDSNLERLRIAAQLLHPLLDELVFVGGAVTGLLITDEAAGEPRTTLDVDAIAEITSYAEYVAFGGRLRALGFVEDTSEGAPLCRWVHQHTILDVMPLAEKILGFSNRWYRTALESAVRRRLLDDLHIRLVTAPLFLATK